MKKEEFFEVLGELDDDIVKEARSTVREKKTGRPVWIKWGALASCKNAIITIGDCGAVKRETRYL